MRRIEARTGDAARTASQRAIRARFADIAALLARARGRGRARLEALIEERRKLERELTDAKRKLAMGGGAAGAGDASATSPA